MPQGKYIMQIEQQNQIVPSIIINKELIKIIETLIEDTTVKTDDLITLNFRDPTYSSETGGYHPVEICINGSGKFQYFTDFSYAGQRGAYAELVKELDFDFDLNLLQQMGRDYPLVQGVGLFKIFQSNFISYYKSGVFEVEVNIM